MIRVFIGTDPTQEVACNVLKSSILRRTKQPVEFRELNGHLAPIPGQYTGFSFNRWAIPGLCEYQGRAIYLDADIICRCDIAELWDMPIEYTHLCRKAPNGFYTSVMLMDCSRLRHWDFKHWCEIVDRDLYQKTMWCRPGGLSTAGVGELPRCWNAIDTPGRFDMPIDEAKFLHYTVVPNQPWKKKGHPQENLWWEEHAYAVQ